MKHFDLVPGVFCSVVDPGASQPACVFAQRSFCGGCHTSHDQISTKSAFPTEWKAVLINSGRIPMPSSNVCTWWSSDTFLSHQLCLTWAKVWSSELRLIDTIALYPGWSWSWSQAILTAGMQQCQIWLISFVTCLLIIIIPSCALQRSVAIYCTDVILHMLLSLQSVKRSLMCADGFFDLRPWWRLRKFESSASDVLQRWEKGAAGAGFVEVSLRKLAANP